MSVNDNINRLRNEQKNSFGALGNMGDNFKNILAGEDNILSKIATLQSSQDAGFGATQKQIGDGFGATQKQIGDGFGATQKQIGDGFTATQQQIGDGFGATQKQIGDGFTATQQQIGDGFRSTLDDLGALLPNCSTQDPFGGHTNPPPCKP